MDYTTEQLEIVQKIKSCKNYYEVLGIDKNATDLEIRKAYKRLALQLHPDKNHAPGASEAFKAIGNAVAILTDPQKRKEYDEFELYNNNEDRLYDDYHQSDFHMRHHNNYEYAYERGFESDISAEELFNIFFGGGFTNFGPTTMFNRHRHYRRESNEQSSIAFTLILILILISMLSSFFSSDPFYNLSQTSNSIPCNEE